MPAPGRLREFVPKLLVVLREGYDLAALRADAAAWLTVAIVALPLSMAVAIASGLPPGAGLTTAIVGGFLVSAFGGSRFQIGGPAGAFIVLVGSTLATHGIDGLILATFLSGLMLAAIGWLRLGTYIQFIPYPVTVGFTAGIAAIIFASQIVPLLGLHLHGPEHGPLIEKLPVVWSALPSLTPTAAALSAAAPLAGHIPLAALAAVLALVAWDMIEKPAIRALLRTSRGDAAVLLVTFLLTLFRDLTEAIVVGFALGALLFIHRMSQAVEVEALAPGPEHNAYDPGEATAGDGVIYRIRGALFFGAVSAVAAVLDRLNPGHRAMVLDFSEVTLADASAAHMIEGLAEKAQRAGIAVYLTGTTLSLRRSFLAQGLRPPRVHYASDVKSALDRARLRSARAAA